MAIVVCNIGWMENYHGLTGQHDAIIGGGEYVEKNGWGVEVCNFLPCDDGFTYGHVETQKSDVDRTINISRLGAGSNDTEIDGLDVVWTATHPSEGGRRVVGFYRNATLYKQRQRFPEFPSNQHRLDNIETFVIKASTPGILLLPVANRTLTLKTGTKGWMGTTPWWFPNSENEEVASFIEEARAMLTELLPDDKPPASPGDIGPPQYGFVRRLQRDRQPAFRSALLNAYGRTCAISGCSIEACLEAAHLDRYADSGDNRITNGILLRADLHRLMDAGLLTFRWESSVLWPVIDEAVCDNGYRTILVKPVNLPPSPSHWPSEESVRFHASGARAALMTGAVRDRPEVEIALKEIA
jgi:hypothetical protein